MFADKALREVGLIGHSFAGAVTTAKQEFQEHPWKMLGEGALALGIGFGLSKITYGTRLALMLERASSFGTALAIAGAIPKIEQTTHAFADAWDSGKDYDKDAKIARDNIGGMLFDAGFNTVTGAIGGKIGHAVFHPGGIWEGLPAFRSNGTLPEGAFSTTWKEFAARYGTNERRQQLLGGMFDALQDLKEAGVYHAYVGGSFVTTKAHPGDFDLAYNLIEEDKHAIFSKLPIIDSKPLQKQIYGGEMHENDMFKNNRRAFFQVNDRPGAPAKHVGVVHLPLDSLPPRLERSTPAPPATYAEVVEMTRALRSGPSALETAASIPSPPRTAL